MSYIDKYSPVCNYGSASSYTDHESSDPQAPVNVIADAEVVEIKTVSCFNFTNVKPNGKLNMFLLAK